MFKNIQLKINKLVYDINNIDLKIKALEGRKVFVSGAALDYYSRSECESINKKNASIDNSINKLLMKREKLVYKLNMLSSGYKV